MKASRLETGIITTAPEPQPVGPLLEGALAQARPQAEAKGLTLAAEPCGAAARFDPKWTAEALFNVVDNAVKYTPAGGQGDPLRRRLRAVLPHGCDRHRPRHPGGGAGADLRPLLPGRRRRGRRRAWASASTWPGEILPAAGGLSQGGLPPPGQGSTFSLYPAPGRSPRRKSFKL